MPRLHLKGGETKTIPERKPITITGWLVSAYSDNAVFSGTDFDGNIFPEGGIVVSEGEYGGANIQIPAFPPVTFTLSGGEGATIYYEVNAWWQVIGE